MKGVKCQVRRERSIVGTRFRVVWTCPARGCKTRVRSSYFQGKPQEAEAAARAYAERITPHAARCYRHSRPGQEDGSVAPRAALPEGLHADIPFSVYLADPCEAPSLSAHTICDLLDRSPLHAHRLHPRYGGATEESTRADLGTAVHAAMLGGLPSDIDAELRQWKDRALRAEARVKALRKLKAQAYHAHIRWNDKTQQYDCISPACLLCALGNT